MLPTTRSKSTRDKVPYPLSDTASDAGDDYDIVSLSTSPRSVDSSIADFGFHITNPGRDRRAVTPPPDPPHTITARSLPAEIVELAQAQDSKAKWETAALTVKDIQAYTREALGADADVVGDKKVKVYVDGVWDGLHLGHLLQLRQAKHAFPSVHLVVGVYSANTCELHKLRPMTPYAERAELLRHCRYVDELILDAPWVPDDFSFDFLALEEIMPAVYSAAAGQQDKLDAFCEWRLQGRVIPTRPTVGFPTSLRPRKDTIMPPPAAARVDDHLATEKLVDRGIFLTME